ncbi:trypsin-like peptidase domain-containing protein [Streptomyces sp. NPDC127584]|uniref:trypsin-like peptidase domain-containing protein n=1 Tax=Streptomyces sp. NPDC127584 TaxID=3345403 RepID=UPI003633A71B
MDPRRLADVRADAGAGDAQGTRAGGSGYLIGPRLVLTARHIVCGPEPDSAWERIVVRVGHPGGRHGPVRKSGARVRWVAPDGSDVALLELDADVQVPKEVAWGRPEGVRPLDYNGMAFPLHAGGGDGRRTVEQLRGVLPPLAGGDRRHQLYVLDQAAAPGPPARRGVRPWGGASGAAVFCQDLLVGVVVSEDTGHDHRRLHALAAHSFVTEPSFQRVLSEHGLGVPQLQPVSAAPPPAPPDVGTRRRTTTIAALAVVPLVAVGVLFAAIGMPDSGDGRDSGKPTGPVSADASPRPRNMPSTTPDGTVGGLPRGTRLRLTATVSSLEDTNGVAFKEDDLGMLGDVLGMPAIPAAPMPTEMVQHIEAAGFRLPGALVNLVVDGMDGNVEITKIRPVGTVPYRVPLGAVFYFPSQGGGEVSAMDFDMDDPSPVARKRPEGTEAGPGRPFFTSERITLRQGETERLALNFSTVRRAYTFHVAVNYTAGGTEYSQFVEDAKGEPRVFRISADPCPWAGMRGRLTEEDVRTLGAMHYRHVRTVDEQALEQGYRLVETDPANRAMGESLCR